MDDETAVGATLDALVELTIDLFIAFDRLGKAAFTLLYFYGVWVMVRELLGCLK